MLQRTKRVFSKLPVWVEAFIILFLAFGFSALYGLTLAFKDLEFTNAAAIRGIFQEFLVALICVGILYLRGWKLWRNFPFDVNLKHAALGLGLVVASNIAYVLFYNTAVLSVGIDALRISKFTVSANVGLLFAVSLINPLFEETFVVYYLFERLKGYGPVLFVVASTLLRVSYHLYQGWLGVISILPFGILFAIAFWKTKNLMPLYFAHAIQDLIGLLSLPRS